MSLERVDVDRIGIEVANSKIAVSMRKDIEEKVRGAMCIGDDYITMSESDFNLAKKLGVINGVWYCRSKYNNNNDDCRAYFRNTLQEMRKDRNINIAKSVLIGMFCAVILVASFLSIR